VTNTAGAQRLSTSALLAFAAPSLAIYALQLALTVHLPRYFATHMGLSLAAVGSAFALVRAVDIPLDPLLGLAMDRTRGRLGRYRPWALAGPPVMAAALWVLIRPPATLGEAALAAVLFVMFLGYSALYLSQLAWAGNLAVDYQERSRIFAAITGVGVTGAVAVLVVPVLAGRLGASEAAGVEGMVWFVMAAAPATALLMAIRTPDPLPPPDAGRFRLSDYGRLMSRPNVLRLLASDLFVQLGPNWMAALYLYDFTLVRGFSVASANLLLLIYLAAGFSAPLVGALARRINKHRAFMACTTLFALCVAATPLLPKGAFVPAALLMLAAGAAFSGFTVLTRALCADIADEARLAAGREAMGLVFALTNATTKLATACALFFTFHALERAGFDAGEGAANTPAALRRLELVFLSGPIVFVTLGGLCFTGYRLDAARHAEIRKALEASDPPPQGEVARRAGGG
jgi:Na+/melibiose symporter-like transporter